MIVGWTAQNPGSRTGWSQAVLKLCPKCAPGPVVVKVMLVAQAIPGDAARRRRRLGAA
jgi:hypothetical protein